MIDKLDRKDCCGCSTCHDACPAGAISMERDNEWFRYPVINHEACIHCHLCEKVCPALNADKPKRAEYEKPVCYAAAHKNLEIRFRSTSGGIFSALAMQMYREGGYVGGAVETPEGVKHIISNKPEDLNALRRSKYTQSDARGFYAEVLRLLKAGEKVLAVGTPCMIAGMRRFLKKDYDNLVLVDFVCNSLMSPRLVELVKDYEGRQVGSPVVHYHAKDKEISWDKLVTRFDFKNGESVYRIGRGAGENNLRLRLYHSHVGSRPACDNCRYRNFPRFADITIADYWGVEKYHPNLNDDTGTSLVTLNSAAGTAYFGKIKSRLICEESRFEWATEGNGAFYPTSTTCPVDRKAFFADLDAGMKIEDALQKHLPTRHAKVGFLRRSVRFLRFCRRTLLRDIRTHIGYSPLQLWRFLKLNFLSRNIHTDWKRNALLYPRRYAVLQIDPTAEIELHGPLVVGKPRLEKSRVETRLLLEREAKLTVNEQFIIGYGSDVELFANANMEVGGVVVNSFLTLICAQSIRFTGQTWIGREVSIRDTNAHLIAMDGYKVKAPVTIMNHTWICSRSNINPGTQLSAGCVVAGMAAVSGKIPAHSLVAGSPAKVVASDILWKH